LASFVSGLSVVALSAGSAHAAEDMPVLLAQAAAPAAAASAPQQAASAPAEEAPRALEGIVVRSRNRIEKLQDVPLSVSVVQGNELQRLNAYDISAITRRAANVSWNQGNQRTSSLSIRGIGKIGQTEAQDPSTGLIVDGVNYAYNAISSSFDFIDIDTVEVARGPQGTLLGKNTSVGVINVTTRRPSFTPSADYALTFSQRDGFFGWFAGGGALVDDLIAWRGTFTVNRQEGQLRNSYNRDNTYTNTDRVSGRVQFLITPTPDFNARLAFDVQPRAGEATNGRTINLPTPAFFSNGAVNSRATDTPTRLSRRWFTQNPGYSLADYYYGGLDGESVTNDSARPLVTGSHGASAELNWKLPGGYTLTSITAYKDYHFNAVNDEGTPFDIRRNAGGFFNDYNQGSQEVRITSPLGGFVDYQAGLYYIQVHNRSEFQSIWGADAGAFYANAAQYGRLDANGAGRDLLRTSLANLEMQFNSPAGFQDIKNKSGAAFGQANWHFTPALTLTTGLRITQEDRRNRARSIITNNGDGADLNPAVVNGVALGGFVANAAGALAATNTAAQLAVADRVANRFFGVAATATPGAAYNGLTAAQRQQVADARAIRAAQIGVVFNDTDAEPFKETQPAWVISPSYKFNDNLTGYVSWQHGEKAGIAQFVNGVSTPVKAEKTDNFEIGVKTALLDKSLIFNADIFYSNIKNYQQGVRVLDVYTTNLNNDGTFYYASATGSVPKVRVRGLEIDGLYSGIRNTTLRFSGAYNDAIYKEFPNAAAPVENGFPGAPPFLDYSGQRLAGAPRYTFNVGADYRVPVFADFEFHTSANVAATSGYYSDNSLSSYSIIKKNALVDFAVGLGKLNRSFDVSLLVKNLFDDDTPAAQTWNSITPSFPRTLSIVFTGKL
jgi:outer membrane receptor protein involved in Fe transport